MILFPISIVNQFVQFSKEYYKRRAQIEEFNKQNRWRKKGIAVAIMSFPVTYLFGTAVYVAIHHGDGTVSVSHGGCEMGQGTTKTYLLEAFYFWNILIIMFCRNPHESGADMCTYTWRPN